MRDSRMIFTPLTCWSSALVLCALGAMPVAGQQFLSLGAGASFPTGTVRAGMDPGWMTELMGGVVLPGNFASLRVGAMYGRSRVGGGSGMMATASDTQSFLGAMGGFMVMPDWNRDWVPYLLATAGAISAEYEGRMTSFAWATGAGATLRWEVIDFYVEGRFLQASKNSASGEMVSITSGVRFSR